MPQLARRRADNGGRADNGRPTSRPNGAHKLHISTAAMASPLAHANSITARHRKICAVKRAALRYFPLRNPKRADKTTTYVSECAGYNDNEYVCGFPTFVSIALPIISGV